MFQPNYRFLWSSEFGAFTRTTVDSVVFPTAFFWKTRGEIRGRDHIHTHGDGTSSPLELRETGVPGSRTLGERRSMIRVESDVKAALRKAAAPEGEEPTSGG